METTKDAPNAMLGRTPRKSNLELMQIVLMLLVIAHHYVVNSGVASNWATGDYTPQAVLLLLFGMWGKICINSFVMITGYFMCKSRLTWIKILKLAAEVYFWNLVLTFIFAIAGNMGTNEIVKSLVWPVREIGGSFTASFIAMYMMIPFINRLLSALDKKSLLKLIGLLLFIFTFCTTFLASSTAFYEVGWYVTLYLIAAYIRLYPAHWMCDHRSATRFLAACVALSVASVVFVMLASSSLGLGNHAYYFVVDSGKVMAALTGCAIFIFFNSLDIGYVPFINKVASTVFGVLLIHTNSDAVRQWLWHDVFDVSGLYQSCNLVELAITSIIIVLMVFCACSVLDMMRIVLLEKPLFKWIGDHKEAIEQDFKKRTRRLVVLIDNYL